MTVNPNPESELSSKSLAEWIRRCEETLLSAIQGSPSDLDQLALTLSTDPRLPPELLGRIAQFLMERGALDQSLKIYQRSLVLDSSCADTWFALGLIHHRKGEFSQASAYYEGSLIKKPDQPRARSNLASSLLAMAKIEKALHHVEVALILDPELADAHYNRALLLEKSLDKKAAEASYDRALNVNPLLAQAWTNRGKLRQEAAHFDQALRDHQSALILHPGLAEAMHNLATVLSERRKFEDSITAFHRGIRIWSELANAHLGLSMTLLMMGRYLEGWAESEWRFLDRQQHGVLSQSALPRLTFEALDDLSQKKVVLFWEQGLGDTLHFCRYAKLLHERGAQVILNVQSELVPLIKSMDPGIEVTSESRDRPDADYHAYLMSLPHIFRTTLETIPNNCPYLFPPKRSLIAAQAKVGNGQRKRIGLVFSGSRAFKNDHNRSIPLALFRKILELPLEFHCLQKEIRPDDHLEITRYPNLHLHTDQIKDFSDTASLVAEMDLVISVDTSVAHLAGAMAKPLWLLVAYTPDNRWFLDRRDSLWYPTARIYRQDDNRCYKGALAEIFCDLCEAFDLNRTDSAAFSG
jgi:tetratricopeptide (TPR) repeat protein